MRYSALIACLSFCLLTSSAIAADVRGSKDPEGFKRFQGAEIAHYQVSTYGEYELARDVVNILKGTDFAKSEKIEGALTRVVYLVPQGHSALEVYRNYQMVLRDAGLKTSIELASDIDRYFFGQFYFQSERNDRYAHENTPFEGSKKTYYLTASGTMNGKATTVALLVSDSPGLSWVPDGINGPTVTIKPGQVVVGLDVVASKTVANQMVLVKADDMARALGGAGKIDLYGIYFDTDQSVVKAESNATLDEIAKLLKSQPNLKLEVGGHTDNTGKSDRNVKLSADRANAVVKALTAKYGIAAARLQAKGYGDAQPVAPNNDEAGRAKNRRVQLRKI